MKPLKVAQITFLTSFLTGTFLFIFFLLTHEIDIVIFSYFTMLFLTAANALIVIYLLIRFLMKAESFSTTWQSIALIFLNIPIGYFYTYIVINIEL